MKKLILILAIGTTVSCLAQQTKTHESDIMYKKEIIRAVDLREHQNKPLFARGHEITRTLLEAVKSGLITPYSSDSLNNEITLDQLFKILEIPSNATPVDTNYMDSLDLIDYRQKMRNHKPDTYSAKDLYQMEIKEDILFDKQHSVMEYNIKTITIFIPAEHPDNIKGIQTPIASFSYSDCLNVFRDNPNAIWYNPHNDQAHLSLADAFDLRLFSSYIIKVSNPDDAYLMDIYGYGKNGIIAAENTAIKLLEFESNLWEN